MTTKECRHHDNDHQRDLLRRVLQFTGVAIISIVVTIFLIWLILRPTKPHFTLQNTTIYAFNVTQPNLLSTTFQITISSQNPNERVGVYYERMDVFASYKNQQITLPRRLPPRYQGHKDITIWSPVVSGNYVPIAPSFATSLGEGRNAGIVLIHVKIDGRVKWKVGNWISGSYHLWVNCPAYIIFTTFNNNSNKNNNTNNNFNSYNGVIKDQFARSCQVDV